SYDRLRTWQCGEDTIPPEFRLIIPWLSFPPFAPATKEEKPNRVDPLEWLLNEANVLETDHLLPKNPFDIETQVLDDAGHAWARDLDAFMSMERKVRQISEGIEKTFELR